jgi:hypothetical protein
LALVEDFEVPTAFWGLSFSAAWDERAIGTSKHSEVQKLIARCENKLLRDVKTILSVAKVSLNLASVIETRRSVHK